MKIKGIFWCGIVIVLGLPGCVQMQYEQAKNITEERIASECPPAIKGKMEARVRCVRDITANAYAFDQTMPIFVQKKNEVLPFAVKYDKGKISRSEFDKIDSDKEMEYRVLASKMAQSQARQREQVASQNACHQLAAMNAVRAQYPGAIIGSELSSAYGALAGQCAASGGQVPQPVYQQPPVVVQPAYTPRQMQTTNCTKNGDFINCTTY